MKAAFRSAIATVTVLLVLILWTYFVGQLSYYMGQSSVMDALLPSTNQSM